RALRLALSLEEPGDRGVGLARALELGDVAAVELQLLGVGKGVRDVPGEGRGDEPVVAAPHEQGRRPQRAQPGPEAVLALGLLEGRSATPSATRPPMLLPIRCTRSS